MVLRSFFGETSQVATVPLSGKITINSQWYTSSSVAECMCSNEQNTQKFYRTIFHYDNGNSQTSLIVTDKFKCSQNRISQSSSIQSSFCTQWLLFINERQQCNAWKAIFVAKTSRWCAQKPSQAKWRKIKAMIKW